MNDEYNDDYEVEAVQFEGLGGDRPWHAVRNDDQNRTRCGRNALTAGRMWHNWDEEVDRCKKCDAKEVTA